MTFLRQLVRSVENPRIPLTSGLISEWLGGQPSQTGLTISPESAMRISAVLRGVQIIAGTVGSLPLHSYRKSDRSRFHGSVLDSDEPLPRFELKETATAHMILRGNAYLFKARDRRATITGLIPIDPRRVNVDVIDDDDTELGWDKVFTVDGGKRILTRYEILHIPMLSLDGIRGIGPIGYARETSALASANEQAAAKLFGQGMLQRGILTTEQDLNQEKADRLKKRWRATMTGLDSAHDVAIMDNGATFSPLTLSPQDAQFLESRKFQVTEIARLLGLPGWMLNDQEKSTSWGTGMEQQFTTWAKTTLSAVYLNRFEQRCSRELLPNTAFAEFSLEGLLRGDSKARAAFYNAGITGQWMVPNEVREKENLPPVPWGDEPVLPYNTSAAAQAGDTDSDTEDPDDNDDE